MKVQQWVRDSRDRIRTDGVDGVIESLRPVYHKGLSQMTRVQPPGERVYAREWDLLIVVDACRYDLMVELAPAFEYVDGISKYRSLDSTTAFWMRKNFTDAVADEMSKTAYVCGNPFSAEELDAGAFFELNEVWQKVWADPGTVPPRPITDETIRTIRESNPDRVIAHYMQPHCPFLSRPELSRGKELDRFGDQRWRDVWERLRDGDVTRAEVWEGYRENLQVVLEDIELLLRSVDAETVVITSDHGNAMGELGVYGHPPGMPHDCLRTVPWIETGAEDDGAYEPETTFDADGNPSRTEQLKALGYV